MVGKQQLGAASQAFVRRQLLLSFADRRPQAIEQSLMIRILQPFIVHTFPIREDHGFKGDATLV